MVLAEVRTRFGITLPDRFEEDYRARLLDAFRRDLQVMPGAVATLTALRRPYCLATTSSPERLKMSLDLTGLTGFFANRTFTASRVARGKPDPDLFLLAAAEMGAEPARCLVIEDSLNGVRAGLAAGMEVWRFTGGSHLTGIDLAEPDDATSHRQFARFSDFYSLRPELLLSQGA